MFIFNTTCQIYNSNIILKYLQTHLYYIINKVFQNTLTVFQFIMYSTFLNHIHIKIVYFLIIYYSVYF